MRHNHPAVWAARTAAFLCVIALVPAVAAWASRAAASGVTTRVSVSSAGVGGHGDSGEPSISADGRLVAFESTAENLGDNLPPYLDGTVIFVRDRAAGVTRCVSPSASGACDVDYVWGPAISADGGFVVFDTNFALTAEDIEEYAATDVYGYDMDKGEVSLLTPTPGVIGPYDNAYDADLSGDGRFVTFTLREYNDWLIGLLDRQTGTLTRFPLNPDGFPYVAHSGEPAISADGRYVAFVHEGDTLLPGDANGAADVFVYDRLDGSIERASVAADGSEATADSGQPAISADGRYVAFVTAAALSPEDGNAARDVYRHDRRTGATEWVSRNTADAGADSFAPSLSGDGRFVAFESYATFGLAADTNGVNDVFLAEAGKPIILLSVAPSGLAGNKGSANPVVSASGAHVAFKSAASDLTPGDWNEATDVFVREPYDTAAVSGRVVDAATGGGLAGVIVQASNGLRATTDADGAYRIDGLVPGPIGLTPLSERFGFAPGWARVAVGPEGAAGVDFLAYDRQAATERLYLPAALGGAW